MVMSCNGDVIVSLNPIGCYADIWLVHLWMSWNWKAAVPTYWLLDCTFSNDRMSCHPFSCDLLEEVCQHKIISCLNWKGSSIFWDCLFPPFQKCEQVKSCVRVVESIMSAPSDTLRVYTHIGHRCKVFGSMSHWSMMILRDKQSLHDCNFLTVKWMLFSSETSLAK
jgi:hypothetical protein